MTETIVKSRPSQSVPFSFSMSNNIPSYCMFVDSIDASLATNIIEGQTLESKATMVFDAILYIFRMQTEDYIEKQCKLKLIPRTGGSGDDGASKEVKRLKEMSQILRQKTYPPEIVTMYGVIHDYERKYDVLVMEWKPMSLAAFLHENHSYAYLNSLMPLQQKLTIMKQLISGVQFLHENKMAHRDIKPLNVLVHIDQSLEVNVCLCDFGSVRMDQQFYEKDSTTLQNQGGTKEYMAPERLIDILGKMSDQEAYRSDVYSVAVVCCEILTQKVPMLKDMDKAEIAQPQYSIIKYDISKWKQELGQFYDIIMQGMVFWSNQRPTIQEMYSAVSSLCNKYTPMSNSYLMNPVEAANTSYVETDPDILNIMSLLEK